MNLQVLIGIVLAIAFMVGVPMFFSANWSQTQAKVIATVVLIGCALLCIASGMYLGLIGVGFLAFCAYLRARK
jgi:hypothetical protein